MGERQTASICHFPKLQDAEAKQRWPKYQGLTSSTLSSLIDRSLNPRHSRLRIGGPDCPHSSSVLGWRFHTRRSKSRRLEAAILTQCLAPKSVTPREVTVPALTFEEMIQRFYLGWEAVNTNGELQSSSQRDWIYLKWSVENFKPRSAHKSNEDFGGKQRGGI